MSDDGVHSLSIITFIGSVFSPYYALRRRSGRAQAADHCAMNVALYGPAKRWSMTERGASALRADDTALTIGPSHVNLDGGDICFSFDEVCAPIPRRVRGNVRVTPGGMGQETFVLNPDGRHLWRPLAVASRVTVELEEPALSWRGHAYVDMNRGDTPIADGFRCWTWCRAATPDGAAIQYYGDLRSGETFALGITVAENGDIRHWPLPPSRKLPRSGWRVAREVRSEARAQVISTLVDAPFYARSMVQARFAGRDCEAVHESLDLDRLTNPVVMAMLPFRMPRRARWPG